MPEATLLAWKDTWSTGIPVIDSQHAALVAEFARLIDPARRGDLVFQRVALDMLTEHICRHFDYEEHLMRVHRYPDLHAHADAHAELLKQLNHFESLLETQSADEPGPSVLDFVGRWLIDHIQEDDKRLGAFLQERRADERKAS